MLPEHVEVLSKFNLNEGSRETLREAGRLVVPMLPEVLEYFYGIVAADPEMARFFSDSSHMEKAKAAQKRHWEMLLSGDFSASYFSSAERIGRVHPKIGLPFLFYLSGYAHVTSRIQVLLLRRQRGLSGVFSKKNLPVLLSTLTRAFALDTHLVLDAHFSAEKEEQNSAFAHLTDGINRMAARDLTQLIPSPDESDFPSRYNPVRESFNGLMITMRDVLTTIQDATASLNASAEEVTRAAEDMSRRTETQAATLEQTAAAVEEITSSMRSAADATSESSQKVSETGVAAENNSKIVQNAVHKMQEIKESSKKISEIISLIEDISFQTNLLALNAGVEAARAGEAGRGFAVVASEVRALAQRAAGSAKEIKDLIIISSGHVESGVALVDETGRALTQMVDDIKRADELTSDVAYSSREQATGLSEINAGVSHLDDVTQQNAAMVEQTTAAMLSMQKDTSALADLVGSFQVKSATLHSERNPSDDGHADKPYLRVIGE